MKNLLVEFLDNKAYKMIQDLESQKAIRIHKMPKNFILGKSFMKDWMSKEEDLAWKNL